MTVYNRFTQRKYTQYNNKAQHQRCWLLLMILGMTMILRWGRPNIEVSTAAAASMRWQKLKTLVRLRVREKSTILTAPVFFFQTSNLKFFSPSREPTKKHTPKSNWESIITPFASRNIVIIAWSRFSPNSRFLPLLILLLNHWFIIIHRRSISFLAEGSEQLFDWENEALIGFRAYQQPRIAREQILFRRSRRQFSPARSTSALFGTVFD